MAYDEDLANRIPELLGSEKGVEAKRLFGGLVFLVNGKMSVAVSSKAGRRARQGVTRRRRAPAGGRLTER